VALHLADERGSLAELDLRGEASVLPRLFGRLPLLREAADPVAGFAIDGRSTRLRLSGTLLSPRIGPANPR
jgi:hypothetical protein